MVEGVQESVEEKIPLGLSTVEPSITDRGSLVFFIKSWDNRTYYT